MSDQWNENELSACVRTYLWLRDSEKAGYEPNKSRVRHATLKGPLKDRTKGSYEYRMQNISSVLRDRNEQWIEGYKPAQNVGSNNSDVINDLIDDYKSDRDHRRADWLIKELPTGSVQEAVKALFSGVEFDYPESIKYDVLFNGKTFPPKKIIGYSGLLHYNAPLGSAIFSAGEDSNCFKIIRAANLEILRKGTDVESAEFREKVQKAKQRNFKTKPKGSKNPQLRDQATKVYQRDCSVVAYVEKRADGVCELCGEEAPFRRSDGSPFLEVHHIIPLSESHDDTVENAAAICPNCHRECHYGEKRDSHKAKLLKVVAEKTN